MEITGSCSFSKSLFLNIHFSSHYLPLKFGLWLQTHYFNTKGSFRMFLSFEPHLEQPVLSHLCKLHFVLLGFREQELFLCKAIEDMKKCRGVPCSRYPEILGRGSLLIPHIFPAPPFHLFAQASSWKINGYKMVCGVAWLCRLLLGHKPQLGCSPAFPIVLGLPLAVNGWFILSTLFSPWFVPCRSELCSSSSFPGQQGEEILPLREELSSLPS